jgi:hypothetical protein
MHRHLDSLQQFNSISFDLGCKLWVLLNAVLHTDGHVVTPDEPVGSGQTIIQIIKIVVVLSDLLCVGYGQLFIVEIDNSKTY